MLLIYNQIRRNKKLYLSAQEIQLYFILRQLENFFLPGRIFRRNYELQISCHVNLNKCCSGSFSSFLSLAPAFIKKDFNLNI